MAKCFKSHNDGSEKVRDTRPEGGNTLNQKWEDILHQTLNGFPNHNSGRRKVTGKRLKTDASAGGAFWTSGAELL